MKREEAKSVQILKTLKDDILAGRYSDSSRFPSETTLSRRFGVSRSLMTTVVNELEHLGLVTRSQGRGTFVSKKVSSRKIGLIVPGVAVTDFFQPIVSEVNQLARKEGYTLHFAEVFSLNREERLRQVQELAKEFLKEKVSGVIYEPLAGPDGVESNRFVLESFDKANIPVVLIDCDVVPFPQRTNHDVIGINDVEAGARIAQHLLEVGAKKIHFLICKLCPTTFENRLYGAEAALIKAGRCKKATVLRAEANDLAALKRHLKKYGRPDAFVCSNDINAAEFKQTLEKAGLRVPSDILLTGCADLPIAALMTPSLTTIQQTRANYGEAAFKRLVERMSNRDLQPTEVFFPAPLIVRESTMKRKGRR